MDFPKHHDIFHKHHQHTCGEVPSIKVIGLAVMMLIGFALLADATHISHLGLFDNAAISISKGYLYFTILFCAAIVVIELVRNKKSSAKKTKALLIKFQL